MLHYDALDALSSVLEEGSFAAAAKRLRITQPAVSQRIQLLEDQVGELLLIRGTPPSLTDRGSQLVQHLREVRRLESELGLTHPDAERTDYATLAIGTNGDSLSTWLLKVLTPFVRERKVQLRMTIEDEDHSFELLRRGEVLGTIATAQHPLPGCDVNLIGKLTYLWVASPGLLKRFNVKESDATDLLYKAPTLAFGPKGDMQEKFVREVTGDSSLPVATHFVGSNVDHLNAVLAGWGWGLVPDMQAAPYLRSGRLKRLSPRRQVTVDLYWHQWRVRSRLAKELGELILKEGARALSE